MALSIALKIYTIVAEVLKPFHQLRIFHTYLIIFFLIMIFLKFVRSLYKIKQVFKIWSFMILFIFLYHNRRVYHILKFRLTLHYLEKIYDRVNKNCYHQTCEAKTRVIKCYPVKFAKFLRAYIFKSICKWLFLKTKRHHFSSY